MTPFLREKSVLSGKVAQYESLNQARQDLDEWLLMAAEDASPEVLQALADQIGALTEQLESAELTTLLGGAEDSSGAILEIHPGAGGTESQDWAEMLLRMYRRWCERHNFGVDVLDLLPGDEAGIKSVTLQINGAYAYGFLKAEKGIHRLIRISPFDSSGRRHTSFASVDVYPDAGADIQIDIRDEDVRVDVFRASGPGGQHVNKTSSAIRLTHMPTGIVVQCQNEKSQHRNKESAFKVLKARLYDLELQKQQAMRQAEYQSKEAIGFGSQIRTYTLQPYRLVKDHRTNHEVGDVDAVLDGEIDTLIRQYLLNFHVGS
ncbi:peptide chain release factor 2 [Fundidesulfovibrio butyratiphilus]